MTSEWTSSHHRKKEMLKHLEHKAVRAEEYELKTITAKPYEPKIIKGKDEKND